MLNIRNQLLLETYKEQAAAQKHEDDLLYRFTVVVFPLSIAALGVPYVQKGVPPSLAAIGGLILMTFWAIQCQIMQTKSKLRFSIMNDIEHHWNIPGHKDFKYRRDNTYDENLRSHILRCKMFCVYFAIVALLTLFRWPGLNSRRLLINETTDLLIVGFVWIVAGTTVGWAMCQSKKEVPRECKNKTDLPETEG